MLDGSVVANDWADLTDGMLQHAINLTELGSTKLVYFTEGMSLYCLEQ